MIYPFPGLSTLIHLLIVLTVNVSDFIFDTRQKFKVLVKRYRWKKTTSVVIVVIIASMVFTSALTVIFIAAKSNTANAKIVPVVLQEGRLFFAGISEH